MVLLNRAVEAIMQQVALSSVIAAPTELFVKSESRQCYPISELSYDVKN
jgi:hypothetical protein